MVVLSGAYQAAAASSRSISVPALTRSRVFPERDRASRIVQIRIVFSLRALIAQNHDMDDKARAGQGTGIYG